MKTVYQRAKTRFAPVQLFGSLLAIGDVPNVHLNDVAAADHVAICDPLDIDAAAIPCQQREFIFTDDFGMSKLVEGG